MTGSASDRAERIVNDMQLYGSEALLISRIPGASHCATEGRTIRKIVQETLNVPVVEIETPPVSDSAMPTLRSRIEALVEIVHQRRSS